MLEEKYTCDTCKKDITKAISGSEYRLILGLQNTQKEKNNSSCTMDIYIYPEKKPFEGQKHFCNIQCLKNFNF